MRKSYPKTFFLSLVLLLVHFAPTGAVAQQDANAPRLDIPISMAGTLVPVEGQLLGGGTPPNNDCAGAVIEALEAGVPVVRTGDNTGATAGGGLGTPHVWEAFTTTGCMDITVAYCGTAPAFAGASTFLYVGCPLANLLQTPVSNVSSSACGDGNFSILFEQVPAGTYYYAVLMGAGAMGPYQVTFSGEPCDIVAPPANDECDGAIELLPQLSCQPITGDVFGGTQSLPAIPCAGFTGIANNDVWYSFVATSNEHTIIVQPSSGLSSTIDLRTGPCDATFNVACSDAQGQGGTETLNITSLNIGQTYYVRVFDWYAGLPLTTTFDICLIGPPADGCNADAGSLSPDQLAPCLEEGPVTISASETASTSVPDGYEVIHVLTQGFDDLVIINVSADPEFIIETAGEYTIHTLVYDPLTLDLAIVEFGETTGFDVNDLLIQGGGEICASLNVAGAQFTVTDICGGFCTADAGTLVAVNPNACLEDGPVLIVAQTDAAATVPPGSTTLYVLTQGEELFIINAGANPFFSVGLPDTYTIHTLVYDPLTLDLDIVEIGVTTGFDINDLLIQGGGEICASLDVAGAQFNVTEICVDECLADAGTNVAGNPNACLEEGPVLIVAQIDQPTSVPPGFFTLYVLTQGEELVILNAGADPFFTVSGPGLYTIHTLVYDPTTLDLDIVEIGVTTGFDVNGLLIQGGGDICASLDVAGAQFNVTEICVEECLADAGSLVADQAAPCLEEGPATISATPGGDNNVPDGFEVIHVLTQGAELVIINVGAEPQFTVSDPGLYTIHTLVYDPTTLDLGIVEVGVTTGFDVNGLLVQGGGDICASLDVAGAQFNVTEVCVEECLADAGSLVADQAAPCLEEGPATISATPGGDNNVPDGFEVIHVLTQGAELVIINVGAEPQFTVSDPGLYTIHTLVYDPTTLDLGIVEVGVTTGFDVNGLLVQGGGDICASLDVAGAQFNVTEICVEECLADAGSLVAGNPAPCLEEGPAGLVGTVGEAPTVPDGFTTLYVLTQGTELVIINAGSSPFFVVTNPGLYTIHTLVFDPLTLDLDIVEIGVTTGFDVNGLLIQGGGDICASLDVPGAQFNVTEICADECLADAGTSLATNPNACLEDGPVLIVAQAEEPTTVPPGYFTLYVLTQGEELVIINAGADPFFSVSDPGLYTIHTLVYDPTTLDLDIVEIGVTTGFDVNGLLIQGGGDICASLDVAGAQFNVTAICAECLSDAGSITPDEEAVCLENGEAMVSGTVNGDAVIPEGYEMVYALTLGDDLVIVDGNEEPLFTVTEAGTYRIHPLVFDPLTLDLEIVVFGETTAAEVNALLIQGGGEICASLDLNGAVILVEECVEECLADAGTLTAPDVLVCLEAGEAEISAVPNGDAVEPDGFSTLFVLTEGDELVILAAGMDPSFTVNNEGNYTIHTLVYDDQTLDLSIIEFGVTTGFEVNALLIQGGGEICASLDVAGASISVEVCEDACEGGEVNIVGGGASIEICSDLSPEPVFLETNSTAEENYAYVLTNGVNEIIAPVMGNSVDFDGSAVGTYHIWGISFNGTLTGLTPGASVDAIGTTGDCVALSTNFISVQVDICNAIHGPEGMQFSVFPNPTDGLLQLSSAGATGMYQLDVFDLAGRNVHAARMQVNAGAVHVIQLPGNLATGQYVLRLTGDEGRHEQRIIVR